VEAEGLVLTCIVSVVQGRMIHVTVPTCNRPNGHVRNGDRLKIRMYGPDTCWEAESIAREWVWSKPAVLVTGPVTEWKRTGRRRAPRRTHKLHATLSIVGGSEYYGLTEDLSANGVSLVLVGGDGFSEGGRGKLTLRTHSDVWCEDLPIRITRIRKWLRPGGKTYHVGAELMLPSAEDNALWTNCLDRMNRENQP
jgi:hypothetical protein